MEKAYFERPAQVVFADPDNPGQWLVGIAHRDEIICGCCGGVFNIEEVIELGHEDGVKCAIYEYADWSDVADEIAGDCLPEGLVITKDGIAEVDSAEVESEDYEQHYFILDEEEQEPVAAVFANTWVDGVEMPSV